MGIGAQGSGIRVAQNRVLPGLNGFTGSSRIAEDSVGIIQRHLHLQPETSDLWVVGLGLGLRV